MKLMSATSFTVFLGGITVAATLLYTPLSSYAQSWQERRSSPASLTSPSVASTKQALKVVELFTSQGCSSCPVSNTLLTDIASDENTLALTYGVNYWDYMGWEDTTADPSFSDYQRSYAKSLSHGRVYTPQMIINGETHKPRIARSELANYDNISETPRVEFKDDGLIHISDMPNNPKIAPLTVRLINYFPGTQHISINKGENDGRVLELTNVVTAIHSLGSYDGQAAQYETDKFYKSQAYAILLQDKRTGNIISAARYLP